MDKEITITIRLLIISEREKEAISIIDWAGHLTLVPNKNLFF